MFFVTLTVYNMLFIVLIVFEELHRIVLQSDLLFHLLADSLHVHVVVFVILVIDLICHNPSLGFTTKARACKVAGKEGARESHHMFSGV
jgi:hypothetical protein